MPTTLSAPRARPGESRHDVQRLDAAAGPVRDRPAGLCTGAGIAHLEKLEYDLRIATANRDATTQRLAELAVQLSSAQNEADALRAQLDRMALEPVSMASLSDRMQRMIRIAEEEAAETRAKADGYAAELRERIERETGRTAGPDRSGDRGAAREGGVRRGRADGLVADQAVGPGHRPSPVRRRAGSRPHATRRADPRSDRRGHRRGRGHQDQGPRGRRRPRRHPRRPPPNRPSRMPGPRPNGLDSESARAARAGRGGLHAGVERHGARSPPR